MLIYAVTNEPHTGLSWQGLPKIPARPPNHSPTAGSPRTSSGPPRKRERPKTTRNPSAMPQVSRDPGGRDAKRGASALEQPPVSLVPSLESAGPRSVTYGQVALPIPARKKRRRVGMNPVGVAGLGGRCCPRDCPQGCPCQDLGTLVPGLSSRIALRIVPQDSGIIVPPGLALGLPPAPQDCPPGFSPGFSPGLPPASTLD